MGEATGLRFSEHFGIKASDEDDWFDLLLHTDTQLFVDPFRVYAEDSGAWKGAHAELVAFFNLVLKLMADGGLDPGSKRVAAASRLLMFPEPVEFCLGYAKGSDGGRGTAKERRDQMMAAAATAIDAGMESIDHFEEMALFQGRFGPDLISDVVCNVLKSRFITYTQQVCKRHGIDPGDGGIPVVHAAWSEDNRRWEDKVVKLPHNPYTDAAVLLVPARFLRQLPTVRGDEFWDYAFSRGTNAIKGDFEYDVARRVDSETIAALARRNPHLVKKFAALYESNPPPAYPVASDPRGLTNWYEAGNQLALVAKPLKKKDAKKDFCKYIEALCREFVWSTEQRGGWKLLWNPDGTPRSEEHVQQLFHIAVLGYCKAHNVDLSPESASGRGPVDFKFSKGWNRRALVEVKLAKNSKFWQGLTKQVRIYVESEGVKCGFFLVVQFTQRDFSKKRRDRATKLAKKITKKAGYTITPIFLDATRPESASKA